MHSLTIITLSRSCVLQSGSVMAPVWPLTILPALVLAGRNGNVKDRFKEAHIEQDLHIPAPDRLLRVKYGNHSVAIGEVLPSIVKGKEPMLVWEAATNNLATVIMIGPDEPSRAAPSARSWLHWLVVNIAGDDMASGQSLVQYESPNPPKGSGAHRYLLLVFQQQNVIGEINVDRPKFNISNFVHEHGLSGPLYGNFYIVLG